MGTFQIGIGGRAAHVHPVTINGYVYQFEGSIRLDFCGWMHAENLFVLLQGDLERNVWRGSFVFPSKMTGDVNAWFECQVHTVNVGTANLDGAVNHTLGAGELDSNN